MKKLFAIVAVMGVLTFGSTQLAQVLQRNKQNKLLLQLRRLLPVMLL